MTSTPASLLRSPHPAAQPELTGSTEPLCRRFDVALLDLDGVVYLSDQPVPGAPTALAAAREQGMRLAFVTNNASRPPAVVAARLTGMGVVARVEEIVTSAQAAAHYLADELPPGAAVLVVGGPGLHEALAERGLRAVSGAADGPVAVVQGFDPTVNWTAMAEAAVAIRAGARWVTTNLDRTLPSPRGPLPGNGALAQVLVHALGVTPESTGKPAPAMHRESVERSHARRPLVVGDRLDTDVAGAAAAGAPSMLVLSGIADAAALLEAPPGQRPDFIARDVAGLLEAHPAVRLTEPQRVRGGRWLAQLSPDGIRLTGGGPSADRSGAKGSGAAAASVAGDSAASRADQLDALRTLAVASWVQEDAGWPTVVLDRDEETAAVMRAWAIDC